MIPRVVGSLFTTAGLFVAVCGSSAWAGSAAGDFEYLTYEQAAHLALEENPDLQGVRAQEASTKFRARQSLAPNNPLFTIQQSDLPSIKPFSQGASTIYGIQYTLGFPGKALTASRQLEHQADALREQALSKEVDLLMSLSNVYIAVSVNARLKDLLAEQLKKARETESLVEKRYALGQVAQTDVLNARLFSANLSHDLLVAQDQDILLGTQFLSLIKHSPLESAGQEGAPARRYAPKPLDTITIPELPQTLEQLVQSMLRNRHQLKSLGAQRESAESQLTSARLAALPDFQLTANVNLYHLPSSTPVSNQFRSYTFGLGVSVPIFFPFNELSGIQAASKDRTAAELSADSARMGAIADLQTAYTRFTSSERQRRSLESFVLPAARASYDLVTKLYALGKSDYLRLKDARDSLIQAQKDRLGRLSESAQAFNQITQITGCDLLRSEGPHACR